SRDGVRKAGHAGRATRRERRVRGASRRNRGALLPQRGAVLPVSHQQQRHGLGRVRAVRQRRHGAVKIQTVNYPEAVTIWADASTFVVSISGMTGRNVRVVDANISTDASFDNVTVRMEAGFPGTPTIYLQNGTGRSGRTFDPATSANVEAHVTSLMKPQTGSFELTLEVETGVATDDFVPLAESGLEYEVSITGTPNIEEVGGPAPPEVCFWTDLVRVTQVCEPGEDPPPPVGGNFQITTTGAERSEEH